MRLLPAFEHLKQRVQRPGTWGAVILFGALWNLCRWRLVPAANSPGEFLLPFLLGASALILAPLPWQWTGDDRPMATFPRGLVQAVPWNLLMVAALFFLLPLPPADVQPDGSNDPRMTMMMQCMGIAVPPIPVTHLILGAAGLSFAVVAGWVLADRDMERQRAEAAGQAAREAQSRALQARMNPHVLFNTISGLAEMVREDPAAAEEALVKLAELLRGLLNHADQVSTSLAQERILVEHLLAIEQFRLGDRLKTTWKWDTTLETAQVPPLLLQPLVENAIKHGIAPSRGGGELEIGLSGTEAELSLWVANSGVPLNPAAPEGIGLSNLRKRLALMNAPPGRLEIRALAGRTLAELRLPRTAHA